MIRNIILLIFSIHLCYAVDLNDFDVRQSILQDIKKIVQNEESIARAYEQYLLNSYTLPSTISSLYTTNYLGSSVDFLALITASATNFNTFTLGLSKISYGLKNVLKNDLGIKTLYESNTFRKRTYYRDGEIHFVLKDSFAKHLFDLIQKNRTILNPTGMILNPCNSLFSNTCIKNNHIYINPTYTLLVMTGYLMTYHIDNFKKGPIVITSDTSLHTSSEFESIPKGALLIDTTGISYVKTTSGIEVLK